MYDCYSRNINYLRISLTDRCNLKCIYCMPEEARSFMPEKMALSNAEIIESVQITAKHGITKVRLTGGEPLLRKGLIEIVENIAKIHSINDLAITTNGIYLKEMAQPLANAGLQRVNISLDAVDIAELHEAEK